MSVFADKTLKCVEGGKCPSGGSFVFSAGEQEFYERKGFTETPKRCKDCREARKAKRNARDNDSVPVDTTPEFWEQDASPQRGRRR